MKNNFLFEKTEDLFKMFRRQGIEFNKNNVSLLHALFDEFLSLGSRLASLEQFELAQMSYERADYINAVLIEHLTGNDLIYWQGQRNRVVEERERVEAILLKTEGRIEGEHDFSSKGSTILSEIISQGI